MPPLQASRYACPRCRANGLHLPLYTRVAGDVGMHGCGACGGVFLAPACEQRLTGLLPEEAIALSLAADRAAHHRPDTTLPLRCPACDHPMTRSRLAHAAVDLDRCDTHGAFYDREEIKRVTDAIRAGAPVGGGRHATTDTVSGKKAPSEPHTSASHDPSEPHDETLGDALIVASAEIVAEGIFALIEGALQ